MAHIFVSYARADKQFALKLASDLKSAGAAIWLDELDIGFGSWEEAIERELDSCTKLLVVVSPAAVKSAEVRAEVNSALEQEKQIIPVVYQECKIPYRWRPFQRVDLSRNYERELTRLVSLLIEDVERPDPVQHTGTQVPEDRMRSVLLDHRWRQRIYVGLEMDPMILDAAQRSCGLSLHQNIIGLIDTSVFGREKEAILFSNQGIYFQSDAGPQFLPYSELKNAEFRVSGPPLRSKYGALVSFDISGRVQGIGMPGGLFEAQELISIFKAIKAILQ